MRRARHWAVRLDRGGLGWLDRRRLRQWLANDANVKALAQAQAQWNALDAAGAADLPASQALRRWRPARRTTARSVKPLLAGGVIFAALVIGFGPGVFTRVQADARTGTGEQREIILEDGSRIHLNTASAVDVDYTGGKRAVRLLQGEALFDVRSDPARPFVVETGGGRVTALGTIFVVRRTPWTQGGGGAASGVKHAIQVESGAGLVLLNPGQTSGWRMAGRPRPSSAIADPNAVGWARGRLSFDRVRLTEMTAELDRYTSDRILVLGSARELKVSGAATPARPLDALMALEGGQHIRITRLPGLIVVRAPAAG